MKLNKLLADAGIASRRAAVELIKKGEVTVNGIEQTSPAYEVQPRDVVLWNGQRVRAQEKMYILLNKPEGVIASAHDERGRKTVVDLVQNFTKERIFPVGRLDRDTTGVLLLTNDGELTLKLTHPRFEISKEYVATLDRNLESADLALLRQGVRLEDGVTKVDYAGFVEGASSMVVAVRLHSGKNRVVRRLFDALGYKVKKLHRMAMGPLTLRGIGKGKARLLTHDELEMLQQLTATPVVKRARARSTAPEAAATKQDSRAKKYGPKKSSSRKPVVRNKEFERADALLEKRTRVYEPSAFSAQRPDSNRSTRPTRTAAPRKRSSYSESESDEPIKRRTTRSSSTPRSYSKPEYGSDKPTRSTTRNRAPFPESESDVPTRRRTTRSSSTSRSYSKPEYGSDKPTRPTTRNRAPFSGSESDAPTKRRTSSSAPASRKRTSTTFVKEDRPAPRGRTSRSTTPEAPTRKRTGRVVQKRRPSSR